MGAIFPSVVNRFQCCTLMRSEYAIEIVRASVEWMGAEGAV